MMRCRSIGQTAISALLTAGLLALAPATALADSESIEVLHLPLAEAAAAARSQLSPEGRLAQLPSRRLLIITDDKAHLEQARALLKRLDTASPQLLIRVDFSEVEGRENSGAGVSELHLPGGWLRIEADSNTGKAHRKRSFSLRTSSGATGHIEAGEVRATRTAVRRYLSALGLIEEQDVELLDITAGFDVQATLLAADKVRLFIRPWFKRPAENIGASGTTEILVGAGNTASTARPASGTAPLRINMQPTQDASGQVVFVSSAETELIASLGETVTLASSGSSARQFASALSAYHARNRQRNILIRLHVTRAD